MNKKKKLILRLAVVLIFLILNWSILSNSALASGPAGGSDAAAACAAGNPGCGTTSGGPSGGPGPGPAGDSGASDFSSGCASNQGQSCNCNVCGQCGGTIQCDGSCSGGTPGLPSGYGDSCNCGPCGCGGSITCSGACSGGDPTPGNYGAGCGNGGSITCGGGCSSPCSGSTGASCACGACGCGGTIQCNGACSGGDPTPASYGQSCNCGACGCGGTIQCNGACSGNDPTPSNYGSTCGNCGTINCAGTCINQGPCSPGQTQCVNDRYQTCSSGCQWQNSGTNADNDAKDLQCGDSLCDQSPNVYDSTRTAAENPCTDSLDNDCDLKTDCNDTDCDGSVTGTVKNKDGNPVSSADISAKKDLTTVKSSATNSLGNYNIAPIACGSYNLVASHPDYAPKTQAVTLSPNQQMALNFEGMVLGTSCEPDCTFASDNIVHASCDGKNGCSFYDSVSKAACDNAQPGWFREYNSSHFVTCASGSPQPKVEIQASVSCESGTLVKVTRIVTYNGKPVKLVVAACD